MYLKGLRVVLGNMARADRYGALLDLTTSTRCPQGEKPFATHQTLRTLLGQLVAAGLVARREYGRFITHTYYGRSDADESCTAQATLNRLLRDAEDLEFQRYCEAIGLRPEHVPH